MASRQLRSGAIGAAGTTNYTVEIPASGAVQLALFGNFDYGSGGTTVKCYVQGSYDQGTTWIPVANITFATADDVKVANVVAESKASWDANASQSDDASNNVIPPKIRVQVVVAGTYTSTTLDLWIYVA